jgi:hypothetical protein
MALLSDIRALIEREIKPYQIENEDTINWCNQVNADVGTEINLPDSEDIPLLTTAFIYALPTDLKVINRLNLQSLIDEGKDREWNINYRIYNGELILPTTPFQEDTLVLDYYKNLTYHTDITQTLDLPNRFTPLYTYYGIMKYYQSFEVIERLGDAQARLRSELNQRMYMSMRKQVIATYSLGEQPTVIDRGF